MAEIFKFFNSAPGDARTYQAADFADYFGSVLSTGLLHTDEVPGMSVSVKSGTLNTIVSAGKAIMNGHLYENTEPLTLTHSIPEATLDRIDRIVLRLDLRNSERNIKLHVKEGAASEAPVAPELQRDNFIYEMSLAQIRVRANTVQLLQSDLVDERLNEELAGLVYSLISIPTSQFQAQWDAFMASIQDEGFASADELATHKADEAAHGIGDKALLSTTTKTSIVDAINEVFQSGNNVKRDMVAALLAVDPALPITENSSWAEIEAAAGQISTGKKFASGTITASTTNGSYTLVSGSTRSMRTVAFEGLDFKPTHIHLFSMASFGMTTTTTYSESSGDAYPKTVKVADFYNTAQNTAGQLSHFKGDVGPAIVTATGFTLPVVTSGAVYSFIAVE